jgi:hypothetical protein
MVTLPIATTTLTQLKLAVHVNGILIPFKSCAGALRRFCRPALFHADVEVFDIGPSGSSLFFRYRGRNFAICTRHQLTAGAAKPEDFTLVVDEPDGKKIGLTPNAVTRVAFDHKDHQNLGDVFLAQYDDFRGDRELRVHFLQLDLSMGLGSVQPAEVRAVFAIGYPTFARDANITFDDDGIPTAVDMTSGWVKLYLEFADPALLDTENRRPLVKHRTYEQDLENPDGLSGAPVFFISIDSSLQASLGFAGMITHSDGTRFMIYEAEMIRHLVDGYIARDDPAPSVAPAEGA